MRLLAERSRLVASDNWIDHRDTVALAKHRDQLNANAATLGLDRLPRWLIVSFDGAVRGLRGYWSMHSWTSWPWLSWAGLLGAFLLLGLIAWRSDPAEGLFLILLPVLMALGAMLIGTAYHVMRTVLPPTKANRLLAAGISGAVPGLALALILIPSGFDRQVVFGLVILAGFGAFIALFREWMELRFAKDQR